MEKDEAFHREPEILSGAPVFVGTRVPVSALRDYVQAGDSVEAFLEDFPGVRREQAGWVLEQITTGELQWPHHRDDP